MARFYVERRNGGFEARCVDADGRTWYAAAESLGEAVARLCRITGYRRGDVRVVVHE